MLRNRMRMRTNSLMITRHNLLKYCELDTYAMVKVWRNWYGSQQKRSKETGIVKIKHVL